MDKQYITLCYSIGKLITRRYSTSFSIGVRCFHPHIRRAIYAIYGFTRLADEIVDTFYGYDRRKLLSEFRQEYDRSMERGISTHPVIQAFSDTVRRYGIDRELVESFLVSMEMDLDPVCFNSDQVKRYIYGSSKAVGLMCLRVFVDGDESQYRRLEPYAVRLGAAFQKVNFLRDLKNDTEHLHRVYFPALENGRWDEAVKRTILEDIYEDFRVAETGIRMLPACARLGVYTAYLYYLSLTRKIERTPAGELMRRRIRVSDRKKAYLLGKAYIFGKFS